MGSGEATKIKNSPFPLPNIDHQAHFAIIEAETPNPYSPRGSVIIYVF